MADDAYLLAYFTSERHGGERMRFAVSEGSRPTDFAPLMNGEPILVSNVGTHGARDPFIVRDPETHLITVVATDLSATDSSAWSDSVRRGSRSIVVWSTHDLVHWSAPRLVEIGPVTAGNVWAPKAYWRDDRWLVFWASAIYGPDDDRTREAHQRIFVASTRDWIEFSEPELYLDPGHDVIDVAFASFRDRVLRFSANKHPLPGDATAGSHIFVEEADDMLASTFAPVAIDVGKPELERGEGPAVVVSPDGTEIFLLIDEFTDRGYHLFSSTDPVGVGFVHEPHAVIPAGARHGSLLSISGDERARLRRAFG